MNKSLAKVLLPLLLCGMALVARADPITGQLNIQAGSVILTPNMLGSVVSVAGSTDGRVTSVEGSYPAALVGDVVTYKAFNVVLGTQVITNFWSVTDLLTPVGTGFNYAFNLGSITSITQSPSNLFITGSGTLTSNNPALSPTAGLWTYGVNSADGSSTSGVFSFESNNVANRSVPDGSNSIALLGLAMIGLVGFSRAAKRVV